MASGEVSPPLPSAFAAIEVLAQAMPHALSSPAQFGPEIPLSGVLSALAIPCRLLCGAFPLQFVALQSALSPFADARQVRALACCSNRGCAGGAASIRVCPHRVLQSPCALYRALA